MAQTQPDGRLEIRAFPGAGDPTALLPPRSRLSAPHHDALREGRLVLQACDGCTRLRHPIAPVCPYCGARAFAWRRCSGGGSIHSWVRFRRSYLAQFEPLMPYEVLCVALAEGPRMFGRLADADSGHEPFVGMAVRAIVERFPSGECVVAFVPADARESPRGYLG
jgi:uncharacterized OB-fold protein